ncbi:MAG: AMIN domain-containing protein [Deltaproteobacteria bacterium]|nr:AMIN domain-containing protein [Deltaproteobacteria bacterium]
MSNHNEETGLQDNIIKLKINGSSRIVNTIEDQKTGRGVSLVCPFPALEVDIPIQFTNRDGEECEGSIHRIGVEDDPETGLPKLRLSVRSAKDDRETVIKTPSDSLLAEASGTMPVPAQVAAEPVEEVDEEVNEATGVDVVIDEPVVADDRADLTDYDDDELNSNLSAEINVNEKSLLDGLFDELDDANTSELLSLDEIEALNQSSVKDPEWVCYSDMPIPGELTERAQTRRRRRAVAVAAWMMVLGIATGGVYVLNKAGVVDLGNAAVLVGAATDDSAVKTGTDTLESLSSTDAAMEEETTVDHEVQAVAHEAAPQLAEAAVVENNDMPEEALGAGAVDETEEAVEPAVSQDEIVSSEATEVILPTRWPAEFSTAYRLQNPNGVVVDVPGGLVKREGWLNIQESEKIIRSIKAVQRENGARFIVYVNGNLPNFKTAPKNGGIRLSLYYDAPEQTSSDTQEVAMLAQ